MGEIKTRHLTGDRRFIMKTTLNLGSLNFSFGDSSDRFISNQGACSPLPETKMNVTLEIKDISVTFEASVEETLADIQMTLETVKELKNLGSELAEMFVNLEFKKNERQVNQRIEELEERFSRTKKEMDEKFEESEKEIDKKFNNFSEIIRGKAQ